MVESLDLLTGVDAYKQLSTELVLSLDSELPIHVNPSLDGQKMLVQNSYHRDYIHYYGIQISGLDVGRAVLDISATDHYCESTLREDWKILTSELPDRAFS